MTVYSLDEEKYYDYDDIEEIIKESIEQHKDFPNVIYKAEKVEQRHLNFININYLVESMQDRASDEVGEWAEDYLIDLEKEKNKKSELESLICDWLNKNVSDINFFKVENINKITLEEFIKEGI